MSTVRELHDEAMKVAHLSMIARRRGEFARAEQLSREAYGLEARAASEVPDEASSEPTRSIMYRSAASLAYQCKELEAALRLIARGLSGYPEPKTRQELLALQAQVSFEEHLHERGIELAEDDLEIDIHGPVVGSGMILYGLFVSKMDALRTLMDRTTQRLMQRTYQRAGRVADVYRLFTPALSVPRSGSFAVTLRLGVARDTKMSLLLSAGDVIDEVLTGMEFINSGAHDVLRERIRQEGYYLNFLTLTKKVAPDGSLVDFVGLQSSRRHVELTRHPDDIELPPDSASHAADTRHETVQVTGVLDYARSRREDVIGLTTDKPERYQIHVREGMDDVVRSYFNDTVIVTGYREGKDIYLSDIRSTEVVASPRG